MFKILLHYGGNSLLEVPFIQRGDHCLIHTVFLTKQNRTSVTLVCGTCILFFFTFVEEPVLIIIIIIQVMSAQQLPDLHHSWGLFHLLPLVHKLHQICPIHLFLQPHLETKGSDNMNCDAWHCQSAFFFSFKSFSAPHVVANLIVSLSSVQTGLTTGLNLVISLKCEMHLVLYFELKQLLILHLLHVSWISWLALVIEYKLPLSNGLLVIKKREKYSCFSISI